MPPGDDRNVGGTSDPLANLVNDLTIPAMSMEFFHVGDIFFGWSWYRLAAYRATQRVRKAQARS